MISGLAGALSGVCEATAVWPTELIKTKLQLQVKGVNQRYTGILDCFQKTVRETGVLSLYRGLGPIILLSLPKAFVRFAGFEYFASVLSDKTTGKTSSAGNFLAGMGAGIVESIIAVTPGETIKTKLISGNEPLVAGVRRILKEEGIAGMYKGVTATTMKQASNHGIRFFSFNEVKRVLLAENETRLSPIKSLIGGMIAGCISVLGNNPIDVIKSRMQDRPPSTGPYKNTLDCAMRLVQADGLMGFYKGTMARMLRVVPGQGIIFASYETISSLLSTLLDE